MATYSVEEEYMQAIRSKSYVDICAIAHQQLDRTNSSSASAAAAAAVDQEEEQAALASHLQELLLEPVQEDAFLSFTGDHFRHRALFLDYFSATLEAFAACATILASIGRAQKHHRSLRRLLLSLARSPTAAAFADLTALLELDNPLSPPSLSPFTRALALLRPLARRLASARRSIARRLRLVRISKKAFGLALAVVFGPRRPIEASLEAAGVRVEAAAKGAYIVARDLETMSVMVRRVEGEVEHERVAGRMAARERERHLVREVAKEVEGGGAALAEQLRELEEHVYLCLLTINRSRRLVAQDMPGSSSAAIA